MLDIVRKQLQQSVDTLTKVLNDEAVHHSLLYAATATADAMPNRRKISREGAFHLNHAQLPEPAQPLKQARRYRAQPPNNR
jgi:hypothetical protein